jgi:hypothetical protein
MSPVWAIPVWWHEKTRPDRFVPKPDGTLFKVPRWSLRQCFHLGVSKAQSRMNWVYSLEEFVAVTPSALSQFK